MFPHIPVCKIRLQSFNFHSTYHSIPFHFHSASLTKLQTLAEVVADGVQGRASLHHGVVAQQSKRLERLGARYPDPLREPRL